jgi:hypothetical protein
MAAGDITVVGPTTPDKLDALLTGAVVVADSITMCQVGKGQVVVVIVKAA